MQRFPDVLVVDDSATTRKLLQKGLFTAGFQVSTASNGAEALEIINASPPDYVLTDYRMPNLDGQMLCRCIRSANHEKYVYLILMTAHGDMLDLVEGLGAGADDYITKPVDMRELLARMQSGARILELDRRLTHVAGHDPLTGVLNRRNLMGSMDQIIELCRARSRPASCIMLDIDHFKRINDQHGHLVGDSLLVQVAELLLERFRMADCVCRYGGEEFLVVLPECDEGGAFACADRCREDIATRARIAGCESTQVTASFGVAELGPNDSALRLIDNSDNALFHAKENGRNQVCRFSELPESVQDRSVESMIEEQISQSVTWN